ncbi:MAG: hypothetical protein IJP92_00980 [Lachnospiraceae bacterium]|nr:hypothetical protein [Lachnospiraceae bacterium]
MRRLRTGFTVYLCVFFIAACALMGVVALGKTDTVLDVAAQGIPEGEEITRYALTEKGADLIAELPSDAHREDVTFENHYLTDTVRVRIRTKDLSFYASHPVSCDVSRVVRASYETATDADGEDALLLVFRTDRLYEPSCVLENGTLRILFAQPSDKYDRIVVIDPAVAGTEADAALILAEKIREIADQSPDGVRIYVTRTSGEETQPQETASFVQRSHATRYLRLILTPGESPLQAAASFNDAFYINGYGNAAFAYDLLSAVYAEGFAAREITTEASADPVLSVLRIPAAQLTIDGIRGTAGESELLLGETAQALYDQIVESYGHEE